MNEDQVFQLCNSLALLNWIILIIFPFKRWTTHLLLSGTITLLAFAYTFILFSTINPGDFESFNSLAGVMQLFTNKTAVLAGWIHYLAFDLMVGLFIVNNAIKHKVNRWLLIPSLFFTFMAGPFGLLLYLIIRTIRSRKYLLDY